MNIYLFITVKTIRGKNYFGSMVKDISEEVALLNQDFSKYLFH